MLLKSLPETPPELHIYITEHSWRTSTGFLWNGLRATPSLDQLMLVAAASRLQLWRKAGNGNALCGCQVLGTNHFSLYIHAPLVLHCLLLQMWSETLQVPPKDNDLPSAPLGHAVYFWHVCKTLGNQVSFGETLRVLACSDFFMPTPWWIGTGRLDKAAGKLQGVLGAKSEFTSVPLYSCWSHLMIVPFPLLAHT